MLDNPYESPRELSVEHVAARPIDSRKIWSRTSLAASGLAVIFWFILAILPDNKELPIWLDVNQRDSIQMWAAGGVIASGVTAWVTAIAWLLAVKRKKSAATSSTHDPQA